MIVLAIRTDTPVTYLALIIDGVIVSDLTWDSGRQLARDLLSKINKLCESASIQIADLDAVICLLGPGSFTGLRIGITVGNTIAYANRIPICGASGDDWIKESLSAISAGKDHKVLKPEYGAEANITM